MRTTPEGSRNRHARAIFSDPPSIPNLDEPVYAPPLAHPTREGEPTMTAHFDAADTVLAAPAAAIAEWRAILGDAWVDDSLAARARLEHGTFAVPGKVLVHLRPGTVDEVAACLRVARKHGLSVNVFSRGKNYGYSTNGPARGATASMELSRLDAITEFDEELGYVRIQAGVTFAQLNEYLASRGSRCYLPSTGGPTDGSVLANTVERGHGLGYGGDRYNHSCRYEVVTAEGDRFETGFGRFEGSKIANLMRSGVGPALEGLFTQSSLGVVTAATVWLPRRPLHWTSFLVPSPSRDRIGALFARVGEASRQGLVRDGMAFALNEYKLASLQLRREDFSPEPGRSVPFEGLRKHSKRWLDTAWFLAITVDADSEDLLAAKERALASVFKPALRGRERLVQLSASRARLAQAAAKVMPAAVAGTVRQVVDVFYSHVPLLGHLIQDPLRTTYWPMPRSRALAGDDLHADRVGLVWVSVPVPMRDAEITDVCTRIDEGLLSYGFEPSTQVTLVSERVVRVITALMYDRTDPGQDERAIECARATYEGLRKSGYYTYRLQPYLMDEYAGYGAIHQDLVSRIKRALDPDGVLDPSRYPSTPRG
jgi:4-cresol dehydrogenase (hydroxylating)